MTATALFRSLLLFSARCTNMVRELGSTYICTRLYVDDSCVCLTIYFQLVTIVNVVIINVSSNLIFSPTSQAVMNITLYSAIDAFY